LLCHKFWLLLIF